MKNLWAPWRMEYIVGPKPDTCVFCIGQDRADDPDNLVLMRGRTCFVTMNKYPYACGHLLIVPLRHVSALNELGAEERHELMDLADLSAKALEQAFSPQGINMGMNMGEAAGAGIEAHLHMHLVPRWNGDHSFMAVFGATMILSEHLDSQYKRPRRFFISGSQGIA